ncbi:MAG: NUDIX hydrolase [Rhizobiales bacterium]|nr:NUDIX hydrolase [Hyphomicrobiales bacterium]
MTSELPADSVFHSMPVYPILSLDLQLTSDPWDFARTERARIDAHWAGLAAAKPGLWNGEVLMCSEVTLADGSLSARFIRTDYASLVAWRDWGWQATQSLNCFGSAAVTSEDGALLFGRMASHTLNAGRVYPPGGSLEPTDVMADGRVDVRGSIARELAEETGLDVKEAEEGGFLAIFDDRRRLALAQNLRFPLSSAELAQRVRDYLAREDKPELAGVEMIARRSQICADMPGFAQELARHMLPE